MSKLFDLQGKTILITGASRGIGFSMAEALAQHGAKVILNARDGSALKQKVEYLNEAGWDADYAVFDVTKIEDGLMATSNIVQKNVQKIILQRIFQKDHPQNCPNNCYFCLKSSRCHKLIKKS